MRVFFLLFLLVFTLAASAQSDKYVAAMKQNLALLDSAKTTQDYLSLSNSFERIGDAEKTQWLPYYYSALCLTTAGWRDAKLDKDANAIRVNALCDKAAALDSNAEIYAVRNMAATQQMLIDPQSRWMTYGQEASADLEKGMKLDSTNPRLYYLKGMSLFNTPVAFGGGKDAAKPDFEKAVALFQSANVKPLYPNWGKKDAQDMLAKCQ
jgi:hypothetical protein